MTKKKRLTMTPELEAEIRARTRIRPDEPGTQPGEPGNGRVLVLDETHQKFNGIVYHKYPSSDRHYAKVKQVCHYLNVDVWTFHNGKPPEGCVVHHDHRKPDGNFDPDENNIEHFLLMTHAEHTAYHFKYRPLMEKVCAWCNKTFFSKHYAEIYCSEACRNAAKRLQSRIKYRLAHPPTMKVQPLEPVGDLDRIRISQLDAPVIEAVEPVVEPAVPLIAPTVKPVKKKRDPERYMEFRQCPLCGALFKVDMYSDAVVCSNPDCVSKSIKMSIARRKIAQNKLKRHGGIEQFANKELGVKIRSLIIDGEPWFVAKDICDALDIQNSRQAVARLDDDEKDVHSTDTPGGPQQMNIVNEFGLYRLILESRKPEAKIFKRWIIHEVLPKLRRFGIQLSPTPRLEPKTINVTPLEHS